MDFNGDGRDDVLSGSYSPGYLFVFVRQADGTFAASQKLQDKNGKAVKVGYAAAVHAADWDSDGDLDLVVGNISGNVYFVPNEGTAQENAFGNPEPLSAGGQRIQVARGDAGPVLADWDGDGLLDLLVGAGDGSVTFYRNTGTPAEPQLAAGQPLLAPSPEQNDGSCCGGRTKLCVADFNGDERLDLLVGDFAYVQEKPKELTAEEQAAAEKVQQELTRAYQEYQVASEKTEMTKLFEEYRKLAEEPEGETPADAQVREAKLDAVLQKIEQIRQTDLKPYMDKIQALAQKLPQRAGTYHGFVWLYLRQGPAVAGGGGQ